MTQQSGSAQQGPSRQPLGLDPGQSFIIIAPLFNFLVFIKVVTSSLNVALPLFFNDLKLTVTVSPLAIHLVSMDLKSF